MPAEFFRPITSFLIRLDGIAIAGIMHRSPKYFKCWKILSIVDLWDNTVALEGHAYMNQ